MEALLGWQTALFSVAVWIIVFLIRRVAELVKPTLRFRAWWRSGVLLLLPPLLGVGLVLIMPSYNWPECLKSRADRVIYGLVCGFFCSWAYKFVKGVLKGKVKALQDKISPTTTPDVVAPVIPSSAADVTPLENAVPVNDSNSLPPPPAL